MLYDGDCAFCLHWVLRWEKKIGQDVDFAPYQKALKAFPQISEEACREAVQLILPDGSVISGAHAIFKAMSLAGGSSRLLHWLYHYMPLFGRLSEIGYQWVAHHRLLLSKFSGGSIQKCDKEE